MGHCWAVGVVDPAGHAYPALHAPSHDDDDSPLTDPNRPAAHSPLQAAAVSPVLLPKVPALQLVQAPAPARLYCPAPHSVPVALVDPGGHAYPAAHAPSHDDDDSPLTDPNQPAAHSPLQAAVDSPVLLP